MVRGIYVMENYEGEKAALVFSNDEDNELMLGMCRDFMSRRTDLVLSEEYAMSHYRGAPEEIRDMAQALSLLFQIKDGEKYLPFVTAGFWGKAVRFSVMMIMRIGLTTAATYWRL